MIAAGCTLLLVGAFLRWLDLEVVEANLMPPAIIALVGGIVFVLWGLLSR